MTPDFILLVLYWILTTSQSWLAVRLDERWLSEERLERAWPPSSRDAAILGFGPLAVPIHFVRTRGHFRDVYGIAGLFLGLLLGLLTLGAIVYDSLGLVRAAARLLGVPDID